MGNKKPIEVNWESKIVGLYKQPADKFNFHTGNPKIHPENQTAALAGAINEVGFLSPVMVNKRTGNLLDGHDRVGLALHKNEIVDYILVDVPAEQESYILATFDPIGYLARHDSEKLGTLLQDVHSADEAVMTMLSELAEASGAIVPDFEAVGIDEQPRLDEKKRVTCPHCGHEFTPD